MNRKTVCDAGDSLEYPDGIEGNTTIDDILSMSTVLVFLWYVASSQTTIGTFCRRGPV